MSSATGVFARSWGLRPTMFRGKARMAVCRSAAAPRTAFRAFTSTRQIREEGTFEEIKVKPYVEATVYKGGHYGEQLCFQLVHVPWSPWISIAIPAASRCCAHRLG